ncbi:MAG TPA: hypothetical protein ENH29_06305 [Bacteroidetes bacterium]|nr:hypothetical protein [Bacteroidota bacterium]
MVKIFRVKHLTPEEVLDQVQRSGVINYMYSWRYTIDGKRNTISFNLRYTGGYDQEKEKEMMKEVEAFIKSIDME